MNGFLDFKYLHSRRKLCAYRNSVKGVEAKVLKIPVVENVGVEKPMGASSNSIRCSLKPGPCFWCLSCFLNPSKSVIHRRNVLGLESEYSRLIRSRARSVDMVLQIYKRINDRNDVEFIRVRNRQLNCAVTTKTVSVELGSIKYNLPS